MDIKTNSIKENSLSGSVSNKNSNFQQQKIDQKIKEVAKLYENHFLQNLVKAMRSTVNKSELVKTNMAEKIFQEKLDGEYVNTWADNGGIGLQDLIYQQIKEQFASNLGIDKKK